MTSWAFTVLLAGLIPALCTGYPHLTYGHRVGDDNYCNRYRPCNVGKGDCDSDYDCKGRLVCGTNNCRGRMFDKYDDCCVGRAHPGTISANIARGKPTAQSSIGYNGQPARAVDGNTNTNYGKNSCTHTRKQKGAWWRVDLLDQYNVKMVKITNRGDCCWRRLGSFEIRVGYNKVNPKANQLCAAVHGALGKGETRTLSCASRLNGRYVFVVNNVNEYLTLCEVQVFGVKGRKLGDKNYCSPHRPCNAGKGDCDSDNDCKGHLVCGKNNCHGRMFDIYDDCCMGKAKGHKDHCKITKRGTEFRGKISTTKSGTTCQAWASQTPHRHNRTPSKFPHSGLENNYCRNPDNEPDGPWCYTVNANSRWEFCPVSLCPAPKMYYINLIFFNSGPSVVVRWTQNGKPKEFNIRSGHIYQESISFQSGTPPSAMQFRIYEAGTKKVVKRFDVMPKLQQGKTKVIRIGAAKTGCSGSGFTNNKCGHRCKCVKGKLVKCSRVRKDFTSMTINERTKYIHTFKIASTKRPYKTKYDQLVKLHGRLFNSTIHQISEFLPWHRWYLIQMENILQKIDCKVTLPYWDWSLWSHNPWSRSHLWRSSNDGLGGNGVPPDYCVQTGPFAKDKWSVAPSARSTASQSCLKREFTGTTPDAAAVTLVNDIKPSEFRSYEIGIRVNLHDTVHCKMSTENGHMCTSIAAGAPEFLLHHGFTDKLWADWQKKSTLHKRAYFPSRHIRMRETSYFPAQYLDLMSLPNNVRITYEEPQHDGANKILNKMHHMPIKSLRSEPRLNFSGLSKTAMRVFHVSKADQAVAKLLEKKISPSHVVNSSTLTRREKRLGFKII